MLINFWLQLTSSSLCYIKLSRLLLLLWVGVGVHAHMRMCGYIWYVYSVYIIITCCSHVARKCPVTLAERRCVHVHIAQRPSLNEGYAPHAFSSVWLFQERNHSGVSSAATPLPRTALSGSTSGVTTKTERALPWQPHHRPVSKAYRNAHSDAAAHAVHFPPWQFWTRITSCLEFGLFQNHISL